MRDYRKLVVWQRSHAFAIDVHRLTRSFPKGELFVLTSQLRRAALSVPTNIVESCGRSSAKDRAKFIDVSVGSVSEAEYQVLFARDVGYVNKDVAEALMREATEIRRMLAAYLARLRSEDPG
jgi:four helix bundle protein